VFVEIFLKPVKPILAGTMANQTGVIPAASFQSATATNHPLLVGKPQARLIKMAKLTIAFIRKMRYDITDLNGVKNIEPQNVMQL
jgi:hypothetical protein